MYNEDNIAWMAVTTDVKDVNGHEGKHNFVAIPSTSWEVITNAECVVNAQ